MGVRVGGEVAEVEAEGGVGKEEGGCFCEDGFAGAEEGEVAGGDEGEIDFCAELCGDGEEGGADGWVGRGGW